jgi:succinyl-diaminopimelate desuccinylase
MDLVETLAWLVDIPSVTGDEDRICTEVAARLAGRPIVRVSNSLVVGERTDKPLVLLVGHLDTVPAQGQGPARIEGGRMHGLGTTDMKGGVATMIHLIEDPDVAAGPFDVVGVFYEAEEGPSANNGLEPLLQQVGWLSDAEFAVVLEPCDGEIQVGCNGVVNAEVRFLGKSSHSARPWWGENAISKAGEWLVKMHRRQPEPHRIEGLEYREVMSVTKAVGGIANNIIPAEFTLNLNYRFSPLRTVENAIEHVRTVCSDADDVRIVDTAPAGPVRADHPFVTALAEASGSPLAPKQGWTDVARLGIYGIPAVNFGPGSAARAHQVDEWVELTDLDHTFASLRSVLSRSREPEHRSAVS